MAQDIAPLIRRRQLKMGPAGSAIAAQACLRIAGARGVQSSHCASAHAAATEHSIFNWLACSSCKCGAKQLKSTRSKMCLEV